MEIESVEADKKDRIGNKPLILAVDNDLDNLLFARYAIESLGMNCLVCEDGRKTLELIYDFLPNLILLDIVMPNLSGIDIAREIKRDKNIQQIPIIAVTGLTRELDKTLIIEAGFDEYISKPYLIEDLEAKIDCALRKTELGY